MKAVIEVSSTGYHIPAAPKETLCSAITRAESNVSRVQVLVFLLMIAGAALQQQQPVRAQAFDLRNGSGNTEPVVFDDKGGHHSCVYGYYGPPVPYFSDPDLDNKSNTSIVGTCQIE